MATADIVRIQSANTCERSLRKLRQSGRIRIDDVELAALATAVDGIAAQSIELFGSRTNPGQRGGDIDLLILSAGPRLETSRRVSTRFFFGCEERIDVVVLDPETLTVAEGAFLRSLHRVRIA
ncbi:MAG: hypothetical protein EBZ74_11400 [Planctomycetia bacterium]|nr:hypothetical protein [Planctomycetia bacterium]